MCNFKKINVSTIEDKSIDALYKELLFYKYQFMILYFNTSIYLLTKERSLIEIKDEKDFLSDIEKDIYYKTITKNTKININKTDLELYNYYLKKYITKLSQKQYGDKYYFGCVAVRTDKGFITTIRGKENFSEYTIVQNVDHNNHLINVIGKKASLNAPLLDYLFRNNKVKAIVHLHDFNDSFPYYEYAFPGTSKDSIRNNSTSFNIQYHGVVYLFDKNGEIL